MPVYQHNATRASMSLWLGNGEVDGAPAEASIETLVHDHFCAADCRNRCNPHRCIETDRKACLRCIVGQQEGPEFIYGFKEVLSHVNTNLNMSFEDVLNNLPQIVFAQVTRRCHDRDVHLLKLQHGGGSAGMQRVWMILWPVWPTGISNG